MADNVAKRFLSWTARAALRAFHPVRKYLRDARRDQPPEDWDLENKAYMGKLLYYPFILSCKL